MKKMTFAVLGMGLLLASCGNAPTNPSAPAQTAPAAQTKPAAGAPGVDRSERGLAPIINENADPATVVPGQYIVVLSGDAAGGDLSAQSAGDLLSSLGLDGQGIEVQNIYSQALEGFSAKLTEQALANVRANPNVKYVEKDTVMYANATQTGATWGIDRADQRALPLSGSYSYNYDGSGVTAYIIDTGINTAHSEFGGRASWGTNTTGDGKNYDCQGHGTHVAGTVGGSTVGIAKNTKLVGVKVLGCDGTGTTSGIIKGMDWVANASASGRKVINMSLGGRGVSSSYATAINNLYNKNILSVVAAGNDDANACDYSPASVPNAITVGATASNDARSYFSNWGSCLDIFAPGSDIKSADYSGNYGYTTMSGTSMASPHVAGAVALLLQQYPNESAAQITARLLNNATTGKVTDRAGSVDRLLYTLTDGSTTPAPTPTPTPTDPVLVNTYTGYLSRGTSSFQPGTDGVYTSGQLIAELSATSGTDFDLFLQKWDGYAWKDVASSEQTGSNERISYNAAEGYYRLEVYAYTGSGTYTLKTN